MKTTTFYIDESGNTGDAVRTGPDCTFGAQPVFALAAIGVDDEPVLAAEIERLKSRHKIRSAEPKAAALRDKPGFVEDLAIYLYKHRLPVFVEIVDKRYFFCMHIVNTLFLPAFDARDLVPQVQFLRKVAADYLYACMPDACFAAVIAACKEPSRARIADTFETFAQWLAAQPAGDDIAGGTRRMLSERRKDLDALAIGDSVEEFLPIPDSGKHGQNYWMLPNLSSFTNIYARINQYCDGDVTDVALVHDEQAQFDDILRDAKSAAEALGKSETAVLLPNADYRFTTKADLRFAASHTSAGLMAADCLAGFMNRHVMTVLNGKYPASQNLFEAVALWPYTGTNFVVPMQTFLRLGMEP